MGHMIDKILPEYCYSPKELLTPKVIVVHFFSVVNVKPEMKFDPDTCIDLFLDLNNIGQKRGRVMPISNEPRYYASAHRMIDRAGTTYKLIPENKQAYHAGESIWKGRTNLNAWSLGIELIATYDSGYTDEQYTALSHSCAEWMTKYGIMLEDIVGHEHVAPGRKKDPGPLFDWTRLRESLSGVKI